MRLHDAFCDGQSKSDTTVIVAPRLPEIIEEVPHVCLRDARSGVRDVKRDVIAIGRRAYRHASALGGEFDRVADKVSDKLGDS